MVMDVSERLFRNLLRGIKHILPALNRPRSAAALPHPLTIRLKNEVIHPPGGLSGPQALCKKDARNPFPLKPQRAHPMNRLTLSALVVVASAATISSALAQDAAAGKTSFNKCLPCHSIGEGAKNKVGPQLNGIDGRHSGTAPDYNYSDANKNSGITWSKEQFLEYIKDPKAKIPGTKMTFAGIKNEKEANDLWAYLSSFDKDGKQKQ
jgi:cytochrome c